MKKVSQDKSNKKRSSSNAKAIKTVKNDDTKSIKMLSPKEEELLSHQRQHSYITQKVRDGAYQEVLTDVRQKLSKPEVLLSRLIHNEFIESISELGAVIIRPIPFLYGGIAMVFGGISLLMAANYYGFSLPNSLLFVLFIVGLIVGLLIELIVVIVNKSKR